MGWSDQAVHRRDHGALLTCWLLLLLVARRSPLDAHGRRPRADPQMLRADGHSIALHTQEIAAWTWCAVRARESHSSALAQVHGVGRDALMIANATCGR